MSTLMGIGLGAALVSTTLWAVEAPAQWWAYPSQVAALLVLAAEPWWRKKGWWEKAGWPYLIGLGVIPPVVYGGETALYVERPGHGLVSYAIAAALVMVAGFRARGALASLESAPPDRRARAIERQVLIGVGGAFLFVAAAYFNAFAGLHSAERAWVYAGLGSAAWVALTAPRRIWHDLFGIWALSGALGLAYAAALAWPDVGTAAVILTLGTAGPMAAFQSVRRWLLWGVAGAFGACAIAFAWEWGGLNLADLPLVYVGVAAVIWGGLIFNRRYESGERGITITALSWVPWPLALGVALVLADRRGGGLSQGGGIVRTREWAVLAIALSMGAAAVTIEGLWLGRHVVWITGSLGLLAGGLLGIAVGQPANVQAYTLPVGVCLAILGLTHRRSPKFFGPHMSLYEAVVFLGLLFIVLPPAEQSFEPYGARYGLQLIVEGLLFLALGLALSSRWLVAGGVLTLSGVALRGLTLFGTHAPYWLTLGVSGMALLGVGMLLLLQRERWDRARLRIAGWWLRTSLERES